MPAVLIEIGKQYSVEHETALMDAVRCALEEEFKIVNHDIFVRLISYEPHRFFVPQIDLYEQPESFTFITIDCFIGRSLEVKRKLYRNIVDRLDVLGIPKDHIKILLRESHKENWSIRGGYAGCDVDVGYVVDI